MGFMCNIYDVCDDWGGFEDFNEVEFGIVSFELSTKWQLAN